MVVVLKLSRGGKNHIMTIEQDLLLSAYLDREVDLKRKRRAEAAVASDPAAAEALRSLAAVRDLVAALSRPCAPDASLVVLNRIAADADRRRRWKTWGPYLGRGLTASAIAASLGLVVFLGVESRLRGLSNPPRVRVPETSETLAAQPPVQAAVPLIAEASAPEPTGSASTPMVVQPPAQIVADAEQSTPRRDQPPGFQELWSTAGPRRDFVVTSSPDEPTTATVETLLAQSTHRDFYKIVVPAGVTGTRDESSVAFAAHLDPSEYTTLRGRLGSKFRNRVVIGDSEPEVAALLADVGQVTSAPATPAAEVSFPQTEHAFRIHSDSPPTNRVEADDLADGADGVPAPMTPADPSGPSVVMIWIVDPTPN